MRTILLFLFGFFLLAEDANAQIEEFPNDPTLFLKELNLYLNSSHREDCKVAYENFEETFKKGYVVDSRYQGIRSICNLMLKRKMTAYPYFVLFFESANAVLKDEPLAARVFNTWINTLNKFIPKLKSSKHGDLEDFLNFSYDFFAKKALYDTPNGPTWKSSSMDFEMRYENDDITLRFSQTTVTGIRKQDSISIENTSGVYYPLKNKWVGKGATVKWDRTGLKDVKVEFDEYEVNTKNTNYKVNKAILHNNSLFDKPIEGSFEDKIVVSSKKDSLSHTTFPFFESFDKKVEIKGIGSNVKYIGGFKLLGSEIAGYGDNKNPAEVRLFDNKGKLVVLAKAVFFNIRKGERILTDDAETSLYFGGGDSIYHPGIKFRYNIDENKLKLTQGDQGRGKTPFLNSYQQVEMYVSSLEWKLGDQKLEIGKSEGTGISRKEVIFESLSLFDTRRFERYRNVSSINDVAKIAVFWRNLMTVYDLKYNTPSPTENQKKALKKLSESLKYECKGGDLDAVLSEIGALSETERKYSPKLHAERIAYMINEKFDVTSIGRMLNDMIEDGFIFYDPETKIVTIRDKIFHYNDSNVKKVDYDIIKVKSAYTGRTSSDTPKDQSSLAAKYGYDLSRADTLANNGANAVLDLDKKSLDINFAKKVMLSDSQRVSIEPLNQKMSMYENRQMKYDGLANAGNAIFTGKRFQLNYDRFEMYMDSVDYLEFLIEEREPNPIGEGFSPLPRGLLDGEFERKKVSVNSRIEHLNGILLIDAPNNKSGKDNIKIFPSFESSGKSYVYYDKWWTHSDWKIRGGKYKRKDFYFELDPFIQDTLDNFDPRYLKFEGKLVSAGIFPEVKEPLRIMWHDLSLGFEAKTPKTGYPIYGGKGRFTNLFGLSNKGLIGDGEVEYLGSKFNSDDIVFLPESMQASSDQFNINESRVGTEFPKVTGDSVKLEWFAYKDSMYVRSVEGSPFKFFKDQNHFLDGYVILSPGGLYGSGQFDWDEATMTSKSMHFGANSVEADTSTLSIKALNANQDGKAPVAFNTSCVKSKIDFDKKIGNFKANLDNISSELPYNKMKTSLDEMTWNMDEQTIDLFAAKRKNGFFLSTNDKMDSLIFTGTKAHFDLKTNLLKIDGVEYIPCADAYIYPDGQHIEVGADANMDTLYNARILADTINKYHIINRAVVKINSKYDYTADGYLAYDLVDKKQEIRFSDIKTNRKAKRQYITVGTGSVKEEDDFYADKKLRYYGKIKMSADSKDLQFEGYARLNSTNKMPQSNWFSIKSPIDRKNVEIQYNLPRNPDGDKLYVGLFLNRDSAHVYPRILWPKKFAVDRSVFNVVGSVRYNENKNEFFFRDTLAAKSNNVYGNQMIVSDETGKINISGNFDFGANLGAISLQTAGTLETTIENPDYQCKLAAGVKLYIPDVLLEMMITEIQKTDVENAIDYAKIPHLHRALDEILRDQGKVDRIMRKVDEDNVLDLPNETGYTFFFPRCDLMWSEKLQSFFSKGSLALASIKGKSIQQDLAGAMEIIMHPRGDIFNLYIESADGIRYFFNYVGGVLKIFSTNDSFMAAFTALKKKDKEIKLADGSTLLLDVANSAEAAFFVKKSKEK